MNEILIYGPIGMGYGVSAEQVEKELSSANNEPILVRINSEGGSYDEGPAIYRALSLYDGLDTIVDGIAYSMAAMILQSGKKRMMAENAIVMIHGAQSGESGSAEDLRKRADVMDVHTEAMVSAFTGRGISEETVRGWLLDGEDHYFTAQQALAAGIIDEIAESVDMAAALRMISPAVKLPPQIAAYRNQEKLMPENKAKNDPPEDQAPTLDIKKLKDSRDRNVKAGLKAGAQAEMRRQSAIREFFDRPQFADASRIGQDNVSLFTDLRDKCLNDFNVDLSKAREWALDLQDGIPAPIIDVAADPKPQNSGPLTQPRFRSGSGLPQAKPGLDAREKFISAATDALLVKCGIESDKDKKRAARENEFLTMSIYEMCRVHNGLANIKPDSMRREAIIGAAITASGIAHSTSDFANILENVASKAMMAGWDEADETWSNWARTGTLPDFKQGSRVNLSTFGDLDIVYENGEYKYGTFSDLKETLQLLTYGKLFGISRQALANDDLDALSAIPRGMGRAAARKVGDLAYSALTNNPVLNQDNTEVFHVSHNNIGTPGAPDVAPGGTIDEAWTAIRKQKDPAGNTLNLRAQHILVPAALEISTTSLIADATFFYASASQNRENPFRNRLNVTADARLDDVSVNAWYVLSDQNMHDTVEVAFLNGQETPYLESKDGWRVDGAEYKVRIDAVAVPLDFRTMFYNAGA